MEEVVLVKQYHSICLPVMDLDIVTRNTVAGTTAHLASNQGELRVTKIKVERSGAQFCMFLALYSKSSLVKDLC